MKVVGASCIGIIRFLALTGVSWRYVRGVALCLLGDSSFCVVFILLRLLCHFAHLEQVIIIGFRLLSSAASAASFAPQPQPAPPRRLFNCSCPRLDTEEDCFDSSTKSLNRFALKHTRKWHRITKTRALVCCVDLRAL